MRPDSAEQTATQTSVRTSDAKDPGLRTSMIDRDHRDRAYDAADDAKVRGLAPNSGRGRR